MQINTNIITDFIIKQAKNDSFLAKYTRPNLSNVSGLKVIQTHPLLKAQNSDSFSINAFVEAHNFKKVQFSEHDIKNIPIKLFKELPGEDLNIKLNQKALPYCNASDNKTNIKLFTNIKQIFTNKKLEPSFNFFELFRNCKDKDAKLDLAKVELVNRILNNQKLPNSNHINTVLGTCVVDGTFNINSLRCVKELLNFPKINDRNDVYYIISKIKRTKEIDKKLFALAKQFLNHPNIFNMQDTEDLLKICKTPDNKINVKTTNLIMSMLNSKKLAQTESDKIHNSTACLELFETCKNKESSMDKGLFKVLENLFSCKKITDMKKTLKTMKIIQRTYNETSSKTYLKEVNKLIKNKNKQSQRTLLLSLESLSNERITNKLRELEENELREAIEAKDNFMQSDFNSYYLSSQLN